MKEGDGKEMGVGDGGGGNYCWILCGFYLAGWHGDTAAAAFLRGWTMYSRHGRT